MRTNVFMAMWPFVLVGFLTACTGRADCAGDSSSGTSACETPEETDTEDSGDTGHTDTDADPGYLIVTATWACLGEIPDRDLEFLVRTTGDVVQVEAEVYFDGTRVAVLPLNEGEYLDWNWRAVTTESSLGVDCDDPSLGAKYIATGSDGTVDELG